MIFFHLHVYLFCYFSTPEMSLERGIEEAEQAIHYFFNNKFDEAKTLMQPR